MRLHTMRHTPLTGDVRTVAALNGMQTASFQVMNRCHSDMLDLGPLVVAAKVVLLVPPQCQTDLLSLTR